MILSMTGYGTAENVFKNKKIHVEIKSLNSKSFDLSTRIAPLYREKEMYIRDFLCKKLERGKIDFTLYIEKNTDVCTTIINEQIVKQYQEQITTLSNNLGIDKPTDLWSILVRLPEITQSSNIETLEEEEWKVVEDTIMQATNNLIEFRRQEGMALQNKFSEKIDKISTLLMQIEPFEKARIEKIKQRLITHLKEIPNIDYDKNRLEQELIYYIEKLDISEEKQRLANHLRYFKETMQCDHSQGKKLGFIAQEMGREINTTGSKSNQAEMQNIVVKMKDELEQIKEQVLNAL